MSQHTTTYKINNNKNITDSNITRMFKDLIHPLLLKITQSKITSNIITLNELEINPNHPIIFSINHYRCQDTPIACNVIDRRAYVLAGKQNLTFLDELFFNLNGTIFIDRKDKNDMKASKQAMLEYLSKGESLVYFPEGTWNLDDSLLMLNMKWGIIDIAKEANAQIIPIILHYDDKNNNCYVKYEKPISYDKNNSNNLIEINNLRDTMSTTKWKLIELCSLIENKKINKDLIIKYSEYIFDEHTNQDDLYNLLNLITRNNSDIEQMRSDFSKVVDEYQYFEKEYEQSTIYNPYISSDEVFKPIKKLNLKR